MLPAYLIQRKVSNVQCKKVYLIWVTRSEKHYEWLLEVIREGQVHLVCSNSTDQKLTTFFTRVLELCTSSLKSFTSNGFVKRVYKTQKDFGSLVFSSLSNLDSDYISDFKKRVFYELTKSRGMGYHIKNAYIHHSKSP